MVEFFKKNKWKFIISSLLILLPIVVGVVMWDSLPPRMTTHWGIDGTGDATSSKGFAVFGMPLILLAFHLLCLLFTACDQKSRAQSGKVLSLCFFIVPFMSLIVGGIIYAEALGMGINVVSTIMALMGVLFIVIGNYLPKCRRNRFIGVRIKWTLENEENWNRTHRFSGRIWTVGGLCILAMMFLPPKVVVFTFFGVVAVMVLAPVFYSWAYYKKQLKEGKDEPRSETETDK